jgi:hypothetical protein
VPVRFRHLWFGLRPVALGGAYHRAFPIAPATTNGTRELALSRRQVAIVDACDWEALRRYRWKAVPNGMGGFYAAARINGRLCYLHRLICGSNHPGRTRNPQLS